MAAVGGDESTKKSNRRQNKKDDAKWHHRSIFEVHPKFFDSCCVLPSPFVPLSCHEVSSGSAVEESEAPDKVTEHHSSDSDAKTMQRWSCNTCRAEFESLQDQRFHFKSDLHRLNIKLRIAGKNVINDKDFEESNSDSLCKDYDVSSISGSEDEEEKENQLLPFGKHKLGGTSKSKIYIQLKNKELVSVSRCLFLDDSESILLEDEPLVSMDPSGVLYLTPSQVIEKLKYILHEPRDGSHLRIILLAQGGHFAGCVFDGDSLVTHKTFHRYVVRAKAGKKQSSKDAGGRTIHSAGASLRRYNEIALKKDIRELLDSWMPYFTVASCIFMHAPSTNRQLLFDGEKPCFVCQRRALRYIPLPIRRPTFKEAKRIYGLLKQICLEKIGEKASEEFTLVAKEQPLCDVDIKSRGCVDISETELEDHLNIPEDNAVSFISTGITGVSLSADMKDEVETVHVSTPLHEAAKSGNAQKVLELLEQGLDPCIKDERGQTPYMLASEKEVRNIFRRFMASNLEKWDWHTAKVPSALTKEMEESQAAKQAEKDAKRKGKAKELKRLKKAKEKAQAEAARVENQSCSSAATSKKEEPKRNLDAEREKRAAAAERRIAEAAAAERRISEAAAPMVRGTEPSNGITCSFCNASLAGKIPFHRFNYKYCSSSCMHAHREILEDG